jgi:hypothetical protein
VKQTDENLLKLSAQPLQLGKLWKEGGYLGFLEDYYTSVQAQRVNLEYKLRQCVKVTSIGRSPCIDIVEPQVHNEKVEEKWNREMKSEQRHESIIPTPRKQPCTGGRWH